MQPVALALPSRPSSPSKHYHSLLQSPFEVPPLLADRSGLPTNPRSVLSDADRKPLTSITPDHLRLLGKTVTSLLTDVRAARSASSVVQSRLDLQLKELARQLDKVAEVSDSVAELKGVEGLEARVGRVAEGQAKLVARVDRLLQRLMDRSQPVLSETERKWFDELERMRSDVGADEAAGLRSRAAQVRPAASLPISCF